VRKSDLDRLASMTNFSAELDTATIADPINSILVVHLRPDITSQQRTEKQFSRNLISIISAGLLAGLLAIGAFWFITTRIILSPVRVLRDTAEKIAEGDINIRSDINTGDEYEQLSDMFNTMLERLRDQQHQLRRTNKSLDLKLGELAESNVALYEANKIKGEFLANVSHELRTPLNSIIGFAEVLAELLPSAIENAGSENAGQSGSAVKSGNPSKPVKADKFKRYSQNIITSSRLLLDLINDLLDIAKIEAGRLEVNVDPMSVRDTCEGLLTLIRPLAEKSTITLELQCQRNLPTIETDAGKVHQILFNFLSNAVKFTPADGKVTLSASLTDTIVGSLRPGEKRIRISVTDTGQGIPFDDQERIFDKFTQLDTSHTRSHGGTGLGLTICRDLARLLQGEIELESEEGKGATFSILLPIKLASHSAPLMPDLTR
jgi:signal transduction histidine kinase